MKQKFYLLIALLLFSLFSIAQKTSAKIDQPYIGEAGIKKKISDLLQADANVAPKTPTTLNAHAVRPLKFYLNKHHCTANHPGDDEDNFLDGITTDSNGTDANATEQMLIPKSATQEIWSNYLGSNFDELQSWPPDPNGAVGPSQVVVMSNAGIKVFEKQSVTDAPLVTPKGYSNKLAPSQLFIPLDKFFSPVLPSTSYTSDPHIRYDRLSKRWFVVCIDVNPPTFANNYILLAVSSGDKITDSSSFTYFRFPSALFPVSPQEAYKPFLDYPTLGVDKNAVMVGGVDFMYSNDSAYFVGYAIDKQRLLHGSIYIYLFKLGIWNFLTGAQSGMGVPQGVYNDDPSVNSSFFIGNDYNTLSTLFLFRLNFNSLGNATSAAFTPVPVAPYNAPRDISTPGGLEPIDPLDTRLFAAAIYKNKLTGTSSLWTAHAVGVNQLGNFVSDPDFDRKARNGSRWYEIGNIYVKPTVSQLGTVFDPLQPSGRRATMFFNPSIAASGQGHAVLSGTTAGFNKYLNVFVAGRYADDKNSTLNIPVKATKTVAIYAPSIPGYGYIGRWGDFSQTVVDPMDDQTIWTFQEYANVDDSYGVRAVQLKAPPPPQILMPLGTYSNKSDTVVTVEGLAAGHQGFFDPGADVGGPGYNRLSVKSSGGVIASNIKFISPAKITFMLNTKNRTAGKYTLVITNPDGQLVTVDYHINANKAAAITCNTNLTSASAQVDRVAEMFITSSRLYPNPAFSDVTLQITAAKDYEARIILVDMTGKVVYEKYSNLSKGSNESVLSLSKLSRGTYLAGVYNSDNVLIAKHKVVKE